MRINLLKALLIPTIVFLHACSTVEGPKTASQGKAASTETDSGDGPPDDYLELDVSLIPDAMPQDEPLSRYGNPKHYEVFGQKYKTLPHSLGYEAEGTASWYGRAFHGKRTSCGEPYDMYAMTAAHRSLPLPTYAKVTNVKNGKEVIVKINDRGPFVKGRLIDLSYAAAKKLGIHASGTGKVKVAAIDPVAWNKEQKTSLAMMTKAPNKPAATKDKAQSKSKSQAKAKPQAKPQAKPTQLAQAKTTTPLPKTKASSNPTVKAASKPSTKTSKPTQVANKKLYIQLGSFNKKLNADQLASRAGILTSALNNVDVHVLPNKVSNKDVYKVRVGPLKSKEQAQKLQKQLLAMESSATPKLIYE